MLTIGSDLVKLDPRLNQEPGDLVITKKYASGFFGTYLASTLTMQSVDTAIVTGCTTSGCVRATVMDALANGFRPIVPIECVGDRAQEHIRPICSISVQSTGMSCRFRRCWSIWNSCKSAAC